MALVETKEIRPFNKIDTLELTSDNKFLQLLEIQYNRISEASRFNDKYQPIGKGTNNIVETIANSEKTKKGFEFIKGALTVGIIGYAAINNIGITETLGSFASIIPGVGEGLSNVITNPSSNGLITQLLADSSLVNVVTKGIEEISNKKDMLKDFVIDKLPSKVKEKYFERENEKAEKRMQLENEYPEDKETYESNREIYNQKTKELLKDIFSKGKEDKTKDTTEQVVEFSTEEAKKDEKSNPWQLTQEQKLEQRRINEMKQSRENVSKTLDNSSKEQEDKDI